MSPRSHGPSLAQRYCPKGIDILHQLLVVVEIWAALEILEKGIASGICELFESIFRTNPFSNSYQLITAVHRSVNAMRNVKEHFAEDVNSSCHGDKKENKMTRLDAM